MTHPFSKEEKNHFIQFMIDSKVLCFEDFVTKKGRNTPYFINTGLYCTTMQMKTLSDFYARMIYHYFRKEVTNLFGPAYKGIPLATATAITLQQKYQLNLSITFNRKEVKNHGESGILIGNTYLDQPEKIVIIEDVVSAGTSVKETLPLIQKNNNTILGLIVSVDRQEKGDSNISALNELKKKYNMKCFSIVTIKDIISFLEEHQKVSTLQLKKIKLYRSQYGSKS